MRTARARSAKAAPIAGHRPRERHDDRHHQRGRHDPPADQFEGVEVAELLPVDGQQPPHRAAMPARNCLDRGRGPPAELRPSTLRRCPVTSARGTSSIEQWRRRYEAGEAPRRRASRRCRASRSSRCTAPTTASTRGRTRTPGARTPRCTARSCGRCGCSPASAPPTTPTGGSRRSSAPAETACRRPSTCRRCSASTPTTRWRSARSVAAASPSTASPTWRTSTPASTSARSPRR